MNGSLKKKTKNKQIEQALNNFVTGLVYDIRKETTDIGEPPYFECKFFLRGEAADENKNEFVDFYRTAISETVIYGLAEANPGKPVIFTSATNELIHRAMIEVENIIRGTSEISQHLAMPSDPRHISEIPIVAGVIISFQLTDDSPEMVKFNFELTEKSEEGTRDRIYTYQINNTIH